MKRDIKSKILGLIREENFIISNHARMRMIEKNLTTDQLKILINKDEIIEDYPDDFPCHSSLLLSNLNLNPYHIVIGICDDHIRIVTMYIPSRKKWINSKIRIGEKYETK